MAEMIVKAAYAFLSNYLDDSLQRAVFAFEEEVRQFLFGTVVFAAGIFMLMFGAFMVLIGLFLYFAQLTQFLVPAIWTAAISAPAGLGLIKAGSVLTRMGRGKGYF